MTQTDWAGCSFMEYLKQPVTEKSLGEEEARFLSG